jgi:hypothetical protein
MKIKTNIRAGAANRCTGTLKPQVSRCTGVLRVA